MIKNLLSISTLVSLLSCQQTIEPSPEVTLDDWHLAATQADHQRYFDYFLSDSSIFMGTDQTERWTAGEFKEWAKPFFERGTAWNFEPYARSIHFNHDKTVCWFEEEIDTKHLGPLRGTGVLVKELGTWKIDQYILSIAVPNQLVNNLILQIDSLKNLSNEN